MAMAWIFTGMIIISVIFGIYNGTMEAVSAAALNGANDAITLCIGLLGVICLWSGVLEVMDQSGLSQKFFGSIVSSFFEKTLSRCCKRSGYTFCNFCQYFRKSSGYR